MCAPNGQTPLFENVKSFDARAVSLSLASVVAKVGMATGAPSHMLVAVSQDLQVCEIHTALPSSHQLRTQMIGVLTS